MASNQEQQDLLNEKPKQAQQIDSLFKLDVKTDNLKSFLENIVAVINNQSHAINKIQSDLKTKADKTQVQQCFTRINNGVDLHDGEFIKNVNFLVGKPLSENTGDKIDDATNRAANKATMMGHALHYLYKGNQDWDKKLRKLEGVVEKKCETDAMKQKAKKNKKKLLNEIEELRKKFQKQMDDLNRKTSSQINKFEIQVKETEKKTLWKIQDAEVLLQKRVTAEFVENTSKQLEDKLMREIAKQKEENFGGILRNLEEANEKINSVDENHIDRNKALKKQLKEMEDLFLHKLCSLEKFDSNKQMVFDKFNEIEQRFTQLERRGDANALFTTTKQLLRDLEEKLLSLDREEKALEVRVNELDVKVQLGVQEKEQGESDPLNDPHKICQLEADLKRLRDTVQDQKNKNMVFETDLKRQFQTLEHKVLSNFALMRQQEGQSLSREEVISMVERTKIICEERNKMMKKELDEMRAKLNLLADLEKRMKKKFSDLSNNNELLAQIQAKADDEIVRREFAHTDEKVKGLAELLAQTRREFEAIDQFYNQLSMLLKTNQQETISVITGNQRIIPNKCLTCGTKGRQKHNVQDMRGYDGRIYKADVNNQNNTSVYESQEVFDIMPNQISFSQEQNQSKFGYGYPSQPPSVQPQYQQARKVERPTSAKTDINQQSENTLPTIKEKQQQQVLIRPTSAKIKN